jgi:hypothetical protein
MWEILERRVEWLNRNGPAGGRPEGRLPNGKKYEERLKVEERRGEAGETGGP